MQPGEYSLWEFTLSTKTDISEFENFFYEFNMEYEIPSQKFTTGIHVVVNNHQLKTDVSPVVINGRTLVPMRAIFEQLEADVAFNQKTVTAV